MGYSNEKNEMKAELCSELKLKFVIVIVIISIPHRGHCWYFFRTPVWTGPGSWGSCSRHLHNILSQK